MFWIQLLEAYLGLTETNSEKLPHYYEWSREKAAEMKRQGEEQHRQTKYTQQNMYGYQNPTAMHPQAHTMPQPYIYSYGQPVQPGMMHYSNTVYGPGYGREQSYGRCECIYDILIFWKLHVC